MAANLDTGRLETLNPDGSGASDRHPRRASSPSSPRGRRTVRGSRSPVITQARPPHLHDPGRRDRDAAGQHRSGGVRAQHPDVHARRAAHHLHPLPARPTRWLRPVLDPPQRPGPARRDGRTTAATGPTSTRTSHRTVAASPSRGSARTASSPRSGWRGSTGPTPTPSPRRSWRRELPRWTRDGHHLLVTSDFSHVGENVYRVRDDGRHVTRLTSATFPHNSQCAAMSPSGSRDRVLRRPGLPAGHRRRPRG